MKTTLLAAVRRLSLGVYPEVSLKDARERRGEARKLLSNGVDPLPSIGDDANARRNEPGSDHAAVVATFEA